MSSRHRLSFSFYIAWYQWTDGIILWHGHVLDIAYRKAFIPIHPPGTLSTLPPDAHVGPVDPATLPKAAPDLTPEEQRIKEARRRLPPPEAALNLQDIEVSEDPIRLDEA